MIKKYIPFWRHRTTKQHKKFWEQRQINWQTDYLDTWKHPHRTLISQILATMPWISLIEIGCGPGANLKNILSTNKKPFIQIGGVDINPDAIALANKTFTNGMFKVSSGDDMMLSDKSCDVILSDMTLIYVGQIDKYLNEIKRVTRNYVVLCEFHSKSWWKRWGLWLRTGYHAYDYAKLLEKHSFYDIGWYKIPDQMWPDAQNNDFRYIFVARVPKR